LLTFIEGVQAYGQAQVFGTDGCGGFSDSGFSPDERRDPRRQERRWQPERIASRIFTLGSDEDFAGYFRRIVQGFC
jgi:hypothetical protein